MAPPRTFTGVTVKALREFLLQRLGEQTLNSLLLDSPPPSLPHAHAQAFCSPTLRFEDVVSDAAVASVLSVVLETSGLDAADLCFDFGRYLISYLTHHAGYQQAIHRVSESLVGLARHLQGMMLQMYLSLCGMKPSLPTPQVTSVDAAAQSFVLGVITPADDSAASLMCLDVSRGILDRAAEEVFGMQLRFFDFKTTKLSSGRFCRSCQVSVESPQPSTRVSGGQFRKLRSAVSSSGHSDSASTPAIGNIMGLDPDSFDQMFPFHFALDLNFRVLQAGDALKRLLPEMGTPGTPIENILTIRLPHVLWNMECLQGVLQNDNAVKVVLTSPSSPDLCGGLHRVRQMMQQEGSTFVTGDDALLFIGSPYLTSPQDLERYNLYLSDFPSHETAPDHMLMAAAKQERVTEALREVHKNNCALRETLAEALAQQEEETVRPKLNVGSAGRTLLHLLDELLVGNPIDMQQVIQARNTLLRSGGDLWRPLDVDWSKVSVGDSEVNEALTKMLLGHQLSNFEEEGPMATGSDSGDGEGPATGTGTPVGAHHLSAHGSSNLQPHHAVTQPLPNGPLKHNGGIRRFPSFIDSRTLGVRTISRNASVSATGSPYTAPGSRIRHGTGLACKPGTETTAGPDRSSAPLRSQHISSGPLSTLTLDSITLRQHQSMEPAGDTYRVQADTALECEAPTQSHGQQDLSDFNPATCGSWFKAAVRRLRPKRNKPCSSKPAHSTDAPKAAAPPTRQSRVAPSTPQNMLQGRSAPGTAMAATDTPIPSKAPRRALALGQPLTVPQLPADAIFDDLASLTDLAGALEASRSRLAAAGGSVGQLTLRKGGSVPRHNKVNIDIAKMNFDVAPTVLKLLRHPPDEVAALLANVDDWSFDSFALDRATGGRPLSCLAFHLFERQGLIKRLKLDATKLAKFLTSVEEGYGNNPYHCSVHAADVLRTLNVILLRGGVMAAVAKRSAAANHGVQTLPGLDEDVEGDNALPLLACYLAAIVHDYEHKGVNNDFLIRSGHELALNYNDISPLENHHLAAAFALLNSDRFAFMSKLSKKAKAELRRDVIDLVLATDMKQHFAVTGNFALKIGNAAERSQTEATALMRMKTSQTLASCANNTQRSGGNNADTAAFSQNPFSSGCALDVWDHDTQMLALKMALKAADLGHLTSSIEVHKTWVARLEEELFLQGDREKQLGHPVSVLMDRTKAGIQKSQPGFFSVVAMPLYQSFTQAFPQTGPLLSSLESNLEWWKEAEAMGQAERSSRTSRPSRAANR